MGNVKPIPEGYRTVTAYLCIKNAAEAIEFYRKAFGAEEILRMGGPGGMVAPAEIKVGDTIVMLSEEFPGMEGYGSPSTLGGTTSNLHLYVEDADTAFNKAVGAGCKVAYPMENTFWGDRYRKVVDPYGHHWGIATHIEDVSPEEMERRGKEYFAQMEKGG